MCGRAAQTQRAVLAAENFLRHQQGGDNRGGTAAAGRTSSSHTTASPSSTAAAAAAIPSSFNDNYNMSPGMKGLVFVKDPSSDNNNALLVCEKTWGLITKPGTRNHPLDTTSMSQHFSNLMFNARSDTLLEKRTFSKLFHQKQTCLIAVDGFFEWKKPDMLKGARKQPYFVYRNQQNDDDLPFLLLAGLYTSVSTGTENGSSSLDTFTILTTDACSSRLEWLHSRMPVCIWNDALAWEWLCNPTESLLRRMDSNEAQSSSLLFEWHPVTTNMSSTSFRSAESIQPVKQTTTPSVKSFFKTTTTTTNQAFASKKEPSSPSWPRVGEGESASTATASASTPTKRTSDNVAEEEKPAHKKRKTPPPKKGSIASFFSPK